MGRTGARRAANPSAAPDVNRASRSSPVSFCRVAAVLKRLTNKVRIPLTSMSSVLILLASSITKLTTILVAVLFIAALLVLITLPVLGLVEGLSYLVPSWGAVVHYSAFSLYNIFVAVVLARFVFRVHVRPLGMPLKRRLLPGTFASLLTLCLLIIYTFFFLICNPVKNLALGLSFYITFGLALRDRYWRGADSPKPYILFLRCFLSFADRSLFGTILSIAPSGIPVALFTSPREEVVVWDPYMIAFSGVRLYKPIRNLPRFYGAHDKTWPSEVSKLIRDAACVVVDLGKLSPALRLEFGLLQSEGALERTIFLVDSALPAQGNELISRLQGPRMLVYRKRWANSLIPILSGGFALLCIVIWMASNFFPMIGGIPRLDGNFSTPLQLLVFGLTAVYAYAFFWKPRLSRHDRRLLSLMVRQSVLPPLPSRYP